jgi:hypothetical protein
MNQVHKPRKRKVMIEGRRITAIKLQLKEKKVIDVLMNQVHKTRKRKVMINFFQF